MAWISTAIIIYIGVRYLKKKEKKRKKLLKYYQHSQASKPQGSINPAVEVFQQIMFALCIGEVYNMVDGEPYGQAWCAYHYELFSLRELIKEDLRRRPQLDRYLKREMEDNYFVVLRKDPAHADPTAPDWMIVLRGTSSFGDMPYNKRVILETLQTPSTIFLLEVVIARLVQTVGTDLSKLAITGHSLGAAMAMVVTRKFALRRIFLNCHFFNPPYGALIPMMRELVRKFLSPFVDFAKLIREGIRDKVTRLEMLMSKTMNWMRDGGEKMRTQREEFIALADWSPAPRFYLNEYDVISEPFIQHFFKRRLLDAPLHEDIYRFYSHGSILRALLPGAESFHLLPRARICRASTDIYSLDAHGVKTWTRHDLPTRYDEVTLVSDEERMIARLAQTQRK